MVVVHVAVIYAEWSVVELVLIITPQSGQSPRGCVPFVVVWSRDVAVGAAMIGLSS